MKEQIFEQSKKVKGLLHEPRLDIGYFLGEVEKLIACIEGDLEDSKVERKFFNHTQGGIDGCRFRRIRNS